MGLSRLIRIPGFLSIVLAVPTVFPSTLFAGAVQARTVALVGDAAPDVPGANFSLMFDISLNNAGQTSFMADVTGSNQYGIWSDASGTMQLIAREGMPAPDGPAGVSISLFIHTPMISDSGQTTFEAVASTGSLNFGIWQGDVDGLSRVALTGQSANVPNVVANVLRIGKDSANVYGGPATNTVNSSAFFALLSGAQGGLVVMKQVDGVMSIVARSNTIAPGTTNNFTSFGRTPETIIPTMNDNNQTAFYAMLFPSSRGIWSEGSGSLQLVARTGTPAPGTTALFGDFGDPRINNAGKTAFAAIIGGSGSGTTSANDTGIWSEGPGVLSLVAREGSQAAGLPTDVLCGNFVNAPLLSNDGRAAFYGPVTGPGVDANHNSAFWVETAGGIQLIASEGAAAPGAGPGVEFSAFENLPDYAGFAGFSASGLLAFNANLRGEGITTANDGSLWTFDPSGNLTLVAKSGDTIEVHPGDIRTVREVWASLYGCGSNGSPKGINDSGEIAFVAYFTDGTSGFFVTSPTQAMMGDMNCDGSFNVLDADAMALALSDSDGYGAAFPGCSMLSGDFSDDDILDGRDISEFVSALLEP